MSFACTYYRSCHFFSQVTTYKVWKYKKRRGSQNFAHLFKLVYHFWWTSKTFGLEAYAAVKVNAFITINHQLHGIFHARALCIPLKKSFYFWRMVMRYFFLYILDQFGPCNKNKYVFELSQNFTSLAWLDHLHKPL